MRRRNGCIGAVGDARCCLCGSDRFRHTCLISYKVLQQLLLLLAPDLLLLPVLSGDVLLHVLQDAAQRVQQPLLALQLLIGRLQLP